MKAIQDKQINLNYSFSLYSFLRRLAGVIVIIVLVILYFNKNREYEELIQLNEVAAEELQLSRNENGELIAKIGAFQTADSKDFERYQTTDSLILALQKEVKENRKVLNKQGSVTQFSTEGSAEATSSSEVSNDSSGSPVYTSKFNLDDWIFGESVATKDSTTYKIGYKDNYSLVLGLDPTGFLGLGKGKPFAEITSKNPYNTVKTLKSYQVEMPTRKNVSIGPSANIGIDFSGKVYGTIGISVQPEKFTIKL